MKKNLLMALMAMTLFACQKEDETISSGAKNLKLTVNLASVQTRAMESSASGYAPTSVYFALCDASGAALSYKGNTLTQFTVADANDDTKMLHNIPAETKIIKVYVNYNNQTANKSINDIQGLASVPYYGEAAITPTAVTDPTDGNVIWNASVNLNINLSRFEVLGYKNSDVIKITTTKPADNDDADRPEAVAIWKEGEVKAAELRALAELQKSKPDATYGTVTYKYELTYTTTGYFAQPEVEEVYMNSFKLTSGAQAVEFNDYDATATVGSGWSSASVANYKTTATAGKHSNMWNTWAPTATNTVAGFNLYPQSSSLDMTAKQNGMPHVILKLKMGDTNNSTRWITIRQFKKSSGNTPITSFDAATAYQMALNDVSLALYERHLKVSATFDGETVEDPDQPTEPEDPTDPDPEDDREQGKDLLIVAINIEPWEIEAIKPIL